MTRNHPRSQSQKRSAVRETRAKGLYEYLCTHDYLELNKRTYEKFKQEGWLRRDLDQALEDLIAKGWAKLEAFGVTLEATPTSEGIILS